MTRFQELVQQYYDGPVEFVMHLNSELGLEKQYFEYMSQGTSVDYAIVSPAHMSTFSQAAPFIDAPFLFRDLDHWNAVLEADLFKPIADELEEKAGVLLIGYAGGGTRNIFANTEVSSLEEIQGLKIRVQGAPIWSSTFAAIGMAPTVIAYNEVYNAIQNDVISAGENEAAGVEQMKFYEVAPNLAMTRHAIDPAALCFSKATFDRLPEGLQQAILRAGKEAGAYGRQIESSEDAAKLEAMEQKPLEAHSVRGSRRDEGARRSGDGGIRRGHRRRRDLRADQRDQIVSARPVRRRRGAAARGRLPDTPRGSNDGASGRRPPPLAQADLLVRRAVVLAARDLARRAGDSGRPADLLALHRADPAYIWTEEMARFLFVWTIMVGAMIGVRESTHFEVDLWPRLSARAEAAVKLIARLGVLVVALVFLWAGIRFTGFGWYRMSELAELPLWTIHIAWPIAGATWLIFLGEQMYDELGCSWARPHDRRGAVVGAGGGDPVRPVLPVPVPARPDRLRAGAGLAADPPDRAAPVDRDPRAGDLQRTTRSSCSRCRSSC